MQTYQTTNTYSFKTKMLSLVAASMMLGAAGATTAFADNAKQNLTTQAAFNVPAGAYVNDKNHSNVLWNVTHFGMSNYYGRFDDINAHLNLNAEDITKSTLKVDINPLSVDTNHTGKPNKFNAEIAGEKFLDAAKYPHITFEATHITITGEKTGTVEGNLTIHGITKPVTLDVKFNKSYKTHPLTKTAALGFSATTAFNRSDFGVNAFVPAVSDKVKVIIETEFEPATKK